MEILIDLSSVRSPVVFPQYSDSYKAVNNLGNTLVIGIPGAGKTEICTQRGEKNFDLGLKTLALMFSRSSRDVYKARVPSAEVYTIHSYCYQDVGWKQNYQDLLYRFILKEPKEEYDEVIVDELQDISPLQLDAINSIPKKTLFAVGDPFQSIYIGEWARSHYDSPAMGQKIFDKLSKNSTVISLHENWRSNQYMVDVLDSFIPRDMVPKGPKELEVTGIFTRNHREEKEVANFLNALGLSYKIWVNSDRDNPSFKSIGIDPKIDLMVMHCCKGREYKRSFIFDWDGSTEEDLNLLYTSLARSAEMAYIVGYKCMGNLVPKVQRIPLDDFGLLL